MASAAEEIQQPDPRSEFVKAILADIESGRTSRDELLALVLYYNQGLFEQLAAFQQYLAEMGPGGLMKLVMGRGK